MRITQWPLCPCSPGHASVKGPKVLFFRLFGGTKLFDNCIFLNPFVVRGMGLGGPLVIGVL